MNAVDDRRTSLEAQRIRRSLSVFTVAALLHTVVDPAVTYLAVVHFEVGSELNTFLRPWLHAGLFPFVLVHLPLYALSISGGLALRYLLQRASTRERVIIYYLSLAGFGGVACWGLLLVGNTLWVLWIGLF
jgi:hypothetical protein